jgi:hypothetical protein
MFTRTQLQADGVRRVVAAGGGSSPQGSCTVERMGNHRKPAHLRSRPSKSRDRK